MDKRVIKSALIELGFSDHEAEVYTALAGLGATTSGPLIKKTGLHRNVVYTSLEHLVERRYVVEAQLSGKKQFSLTDPEIFEAVFTRKLEVARRVAEHVAKLNTYPVQEITVHEGNEAYLRLLTDSLRKLPKGGYSYVVGTGGEAFMERTMRKLWDRYHSVVRSQGVAIKMISYESHRAMLEEDLAEEKDLYQIRYLPDEIENPSGVRIYPEAGVIVNMIYSTDVQPVTAIRIKNIDLVQGQLNLFNNLWKMAKE